MQRVPAAFYNRAGKRFVPLTGGESSADGAARAREGYLFFKKRYPSLTPSQRKFALAVLISKECGACGMMVPAWRHCFARRHWLCYTI